MAEYIDVDRRAFPLYYKIKDNHENKQLFAYYLEYLTFVLPQARVLPALEWLVKNKITGEKFVQFIRHECQLSPLEFVRHVTMRLEREKTLRHLHVKDIQA